MVAPAPAVAFSGETVPSEAGPGIGIVTKGLTKHFGPIVALDGLDLEVPSGSIFGFLGRNGAGKTTTLRLLTGLARATAGRGWVAGTEVGRDGAALARHIGYLDQDPRFYGWMTGRELLEFAGRLYGMAGPALRTRVDEVLDLVGLADAAKRRIGSYSGGMRQRLGVGQAMLQRPDVLFLDEPVSSLDPEGRRDVLDIIARLRGTATVFMSTHILNDVERVCDRVGILDRGRLVTVASIEDLLNRYAQPIFELDPEPGQSSAINRLVGLLRGQPWVREVHVRYGLIRVHVSDPAIAGRAILPLVVADGIVLARFDRVRPSLEDVFLLLVKAPTASEPVR